MSGIAALWMVIAFPLGFIFAITWLYKVSDFFKYVRKVHPVEYKKMGSPSLTSNNNPKSNKEFLKFILGKHPEESGDSVLIEKCEYLRKIFYIFSFIFISMFFCVLIMGLSGS